MLGTQLRASGVGRPCFWVSSGPGEQPSSQGTCPAGQMDLRRPPPAQPVPSGLSREKQRPQTGTQRQVRCFLVVLGTLQSCIRVRESGCGTLGLLPHWNPEAEDKRLSFPHKSWSSSPVLEVGSSVARGSEDETRFFWFPAGRAPSSQPPSGAIWPCTRVEGVVSACRRVRGLGEGCPLPLPRASASGLSGTLSPSLLQQRKLGGCESLEAYLIETKIFHFFLGTNNLFKNKCSLCSWKS